MRSVFVAGASPKDYIGRMNADAAPSTKAAEQSISRAVLGVVACIGALLAGTCYLWARHGTAVFHEILLAGLALCF
jgi:hypothetical protein